MLHYGRQKLRRLDEYEARLRRAHLTIGDFRRTLRLGERKGGRDAFYFLDPPWPGLGGYSKHYESIQGRDGSDDELSPAVVRRAVDPLTGKVWVIYNDHPAVREAFCGRSGRSGKWRCYHVRLLGADRHGGGSRMMRWILAANYDVRAAR